MDEAADEPSDFEWRNLKKLAVLVLSSLVWKNTLVQNQIRPLGGIEAVLNCCSFDEHNPYIREHAIMCLRFLMEGNRDNQDRIRALEQYNQARDGAKGATPVEQSLSRKMDEAGATGVPVNVKVPDEVLDQQGYETYMDGKGQVMLRKRLPMSLAQVKAQVNFARGLPEQQPLPVFAHGVGPPSSVLASAAAAAAGAAKGVEAAAAATATASTSATTPTPASASATATATTTAAGPSTPRPRTLGPQFRARVRAQRRRRA
ncbi:hypothetical protein OPT61_g8952 [Boeremia exigua]|uniref:Uncharacterized protein n=1 Tax=Boeremia exigua TaxID=749465 RepID=A0ACC2HW51_9PLEO|nr:hypothetical protein OPT61_g8952 [Boeremia exigua]